MHEAERDALRAAVELLHGRSAVFRQVDDVTVAIHGRNIWRRTVATFELAGDLDSRLCYAWTDEDPHDRKVHHRVVLHGGRVRSPRDALSAFFLAGTPAGID